MGDLVDIFNGKNDQKSPAAEAVTEAVRALDGCEPVYDELRRMMPADKAKRVIGLLERHDVASLTDEELRTLDAAYGRVDPEEHAWFKAASDEELRAIVEGR